jgi:hypothetical protein
MKYHIRPQIQRLACNFKRVQNSEYSQNALEITEFLCDCISFISHSASLVSVSVEKTTPTAAHSSVECSEFSKQWRSTTTPVQTDLAVKEKPLLYPFACVTSSPSPSSSGWSPALSYSHAPLLDCSCSCLVRPGERITIVLSGPMVGLELPSFCFW